MADNQDNVGETIQYIQIGDTKHPIDATTLGGTSVSDFQTKSNLKTTMTNSNTDYPSTSCVKNYVDEVLGNIANRLSEI